MPKRDENEIEKDLVDRNKGRNFMPELKNNN